VPTETKEKAKGLSGAGMNSLIVQGAMRLVARPLGRAALIFGASGTLRWWQGWVYVALVSLAETCIAIIVIKRDPALATRRLKSGAKAEPRFRQKVLMALLTPLSVGLLIIPGLAVRFGWPRLATAWSLVGDMLVLFALLLVYRVFRTNSFAAGVITVMPEQMLVSTGPYAVVRHPMYAALALFYFGIPLALGAAQGLLLSILVTSLVALRLLDEETLLRASLPGYQEYCERVRFRLIPTIW
jgi:protein-S-isoprenylcysteine O-methyltransferase Ste14